MEEGQPTPPVTPSPKKKRFHLPLHVKAGLAIFTLAGSCTLALLPSMVGGERGEGIMPPFTLFLISGLLMVALTAGLFAFFNKFGLGFGKTVLMLAIGYNAMIAVIKFCLAPLGMYLASEHGPLTAQVGNPNEPFYYWLVGGLVLLLYVLVFRAMYTHYRRKMLQVPAKQGIFKDARNWLILILILLVLGIFARGVIFVPLIFAWPALEYLGYLLGVISVPIIAAVIVAIVLAKKGFAAVTEQAIAVGNPALLAAFFWIGLSLILIYHIMWLVFMVTLIQLWPFNTYTPK